MHADEISFSGKLFSVLDGVGDFERDRYYYSVNVTVKDDFYFPLSQIAGLINDLIKKLAPKYIDQHFTLYRMHAANIWPTAYWSEDVPSLLPLELPKK